MKIKTFVLPTKANSYQEMLHLIESSSCSFTQGRRNDDIVNWFLAKRLVEIDSGYDVRIEQAYIDDFKKLMKSMTQEQLTDLNYWEDYPEQKIQTLYDYYGKRNTVNELHYLWLTQDYEVPGA